MTLTSITVVQNQVFRKFYVKYFAWYSLAISSCWHAPTASYISVHTNISYGFPSQPLLGTSTTLNCSVTLHPPSLNISVLTIQYQWSSNGTARGNESELMLPSLSPADATTYNCNVTVASSIQGYVISNLSTYILRARRELSLAYILSDNFTTDIQLMLPILNSQMVVGVSTMLEKKPT